MPRPRDPSIDRAVVDACVELLGEVGRSHLSRGQIARRAGVSLPAVNRRFDSVDDIILAIARTPMNADPLPATHDLRSHLIARFTRAASTLDRMPVRRAAAELVAAVAGDERIDAAFTASLTAQRAETLEVVEEGAQERRDLRRRRRRASPRPLERRVVLPPAVAQSALDPKPRWSRSSTSCSPASKPAVVD